MSDPFCFDDSVKDAIVSELVSRAFKLIERDSGPQTAKNVAQEAIVYSGFEDKLLSNHFNELYNWCSYLEFIGLAGKPMSTIVKTIQLNYQCSPNRKVADDTNGQSYFEDDFISQSGNVIIEGDPGSGKTTTLKRLLYNYFFSETKIPSHFNYPILVRLRLVEPGADLYSFIANLLGLKYETTIEQYEVQVVVQENIVKHGQLIMVESVQTKKRTRTVHFIDGERIENKLARILEENKVILIIDGLDELKPELLDIITGQIKELGMKFVHSKIIMTSRPKYIDTAFLCFSIYKVSPLNSSQIKEIAGLWLKKGTPEEFLEELEQKSYFELANRPLFLCFLILLYIENQKESERKLPMLSKEVYEQIIDLLIVKWDKERSIPRISKYSDFDKKKKLKFLSFLSFRLTYVTKAKIFSHDQLVESYISIAPHFNLPIEEAESVAREIENHTGIIIDSFYRKYEFSHLALQEYLCALYIIGAPFNEKINIYIFQYPPPLALAVALSTDSSMWLAELIAKFRANQNPTTITQISSQILDRICIESPYFDLNTKLALELISLCSVCDCNNDNFKFIFDKFIAENKNVERSILDVLMQYENIGSDTSNRIAFKRKINSSFSNYPVFSFLPKSSYLLKLT